LVGHSALAERLGRNQRFAATGAVMTAGVFAEGTLPAKTKQVIAVAVAHVTQCPYCIKGHTKAALRHGATPEELMEAIWVAAEMRAGGAYAHSGVSLVAMDEAADQAPSS
jgi:AhpD family alkylhydroperoxidase